MVALACTFEEFLVSQNLDDWPRYPYLPEVDPRPLISQIRNDYPLDTVTQYLYDNAPLPYEIISNLEKRVDECKVEVHEHAKSIFTLESEKSEIDEQLVSLPEQAEKTSPPESQGILKKKKKKEVKFTADASQELSWKKVQYYKFPGFNRRKLTKLPNRLEPAQIWDLILKDQTLTGVNVKVLKQLFLSEASLAILQDCFWWWFLHKFKPNQDDQDHLFDRISDSYVALLLNTPSYIKDPFFQMYPDCLSQAIYVTFYESFPESSDRFDDVFKDELMELVFQWIRGFKPQKFAWKKWKFGWLEKPIITKVEKDSFSKLSVINPGNRKRTVSRSFTDINMLEIFSVGCILEQIKIHKQCDFSWQMKDKGKNEYNQQKRFNHRCCEELAQLQEERKKDDRKFRRMLAEITKSPTEGRLKMEKFLTQMESAKLNHRTSYGVESAEKGSG